MAERCPSLRDLDMSYCQGLNAIGYDESLVAEVRAIRPGCHVTAGEHDYLDDY